MNRSLIKDKKLISKLNGISVDSSPGALTPTTFEYVADGPAITSAINAVVCQYAMKTDLFIGQRISYPDVSPGELALYLYILYHYHIKKVGNLVGPNAGSIPNNCNWAVPLGYAKWLEGFGPYKEDGCLFSTVQNSSPLSGYNATRWFPSTQAGSFATSEFSGQSYRPLAPAATGELNFLADGISFNYIAFLDQCPKISRCLAEIGVSCMSVDDISPVAPNASVYAIPNAPLVNLNFRNWWNCYSTNFNAQEAMLYSQVEFENHLLFQVSKPIQYATETGGPDSFSILSPVYLLMFAWWNAKRYKKGPIIGTTRYCKAHLTSLFPTFQPVRCDVLKRNMAAHYSALLTYFFKTSPSYPDPDFYVFTCWNLIISMMIQWRLNVGSPRYRPLALGNYATPQQLFASAAWSSIQLPAILSDQIASVGPVVYRGTLVVPEPQFSTSNTLSPYNQFETGFAALAGASVYMPYGHPFVGTSIVAPTPPVFEGYTIDSAFISALWVLGCNVLADEPIRSYMAFFHSAVIGTQLSSSLVHLHYDPCGAAFANLTQANFLNTTGTGVPVYPLSYEPVKPYELVYSDYDVKGLSSSIQLSKAEMLLALLYGYTGGNLEGIAIRTNYKFSSHIPNGSSFSGILRDFIEMTFSPESTFSSVIGKRSEKFNPLLADSSIVSIYRSTASDCSWRNAFLSVAHVLAPIVKTGVGLISRGACSLVALPVGPNASQAAGTLCSQTSDNVIDWVSSRIGIQSSDIVPSDKGLVDNKKPSVTQVEREVAKILPSVAVNAVEEEAKVLAVSIKKKKKKKSPKTKVAAEIGRAHV